MELVKYQLRIYFKGNRFIPPFLVAALFLYMMYQMKPVSIVSSFSMGCYMVFLVMAWIGFDAPSSEDAEMEQIQFLRVQSAWIYYMSKVLFLIVLGFLIVCFCLILPVLVNVSDHMELFGRPLTGYDICNAFLLLSGCSFAGETLGSILHPCVMKNRKAATLLTILFAVMTIIRTPVVQKFSLLKWVVWVLPPVDKVPEIYRNAEYFRLAQTIKILLFLVTYGIIYSMIKSIICIKRKF